MSAGRSAPPAARSPIRKSTRLAFALALTAGACAAPRSLPNIVIVSLDTVRADAFAPDGLARAGSGRAYLQRDAIYFSQARAPMAFTLPSHMTMWTGASPRVHRVLGVRDRLSDAIGTLPEILAAAGYRTLGVFSNSWLSGNFGFARGFEHWERVEDDLVYADRVSARALSLVTASDGRPTFLFAHFMDAHSDTELRGNRLPYYSPPKVCGDLDPLTLARASCDGQGRCATEFLLSADREKRAVGEETIGTLRALYECGVEALDADLGRFFEALDRQGLWRDALVIVLSDHGEEFREHGRFVHSQTYEESIRVPLWLKLPDGRRPRLRVDTSMSVADLLPTVLEVAGLGARLPASCTEGRSLLGAMRGDASFASRANLAQDKLFRATWAITQGNLKLIFHRREQTARLFDLRDDPKETRDLASARPLEVQRLRDLAEEKIRNDDLAARAYPAVAASDPVLDEATREQLRALGYLQ